MLPSDKRSSKLMDTFAETITEKSSSRRIAEAARTEEADALYDVTRTGSSNKTVNVSEFKSTETLTIDGPIASSTNERTARGETTAATLVPKML